MRKRNALIGMLVVVAAAMATVGIAGSRFHETKYATITVELSTAVAFEYTNTEDRVGVGSVFVTTDNPTNSWVLFLVSNNNAYTNVLTSNTLYTPGNVTLKYDGAGNVPLGKGSRLRCTGTVNTNDHPGTNYVHYTIQTVE